MCSELSRQLTAGDGGVETGEEALLTIGVGDFNRSHILTFLAGQPNPHPHRP